jgi:penicillin-binding protein 1C
VYSAEAASLIANILSDADARALEFGRDSVLHFPVQTAVKTGTSSDFRDAWAVGFNYRYAVGIWMGNLDQTPSDGVTGSTGPALLLRGVFAELTRDRDTRPLYLAPALVRRSVCVPMPLSAASTEPCLARSEWFLPGAPEGAAAIDAARVGEAIRMSRPTNGLKLAYDPRLPADAQAFEFAVKGLEAGDRVQWTIDGRPRSGDGGTYVWMLARGEHRVAATVWRRGERLLDLDEVAFDVR